MRCLLGPYELGTLVLGVGDETRALVALGGDSGDGVDLVDASILVRGLLPLLGQGNGSLVACCYMSVGDGCGIVG